MPLRITISDDLQITPGGHGHLSKSNRNLEAAEIEVFNWIKINPNHPRIKEVEAWLEAATERVQDIHEERAIERRWDDFKKEALEKLTDYYRSQGHMRDGRDREQNSALKKYCKELKENRSSHQRRFQNTTRF
jgi:hypothetical protein